VFLRNSEGTGVVSGALLLYVLKLAEPDVDLTLSRQCRVRGVDKVFLYAFAPVTAEVTTDGSWLSQRRIGDTGECADSFDDSFTFDDGGNDRAFGHEVYEWLKEVFSFVLFIVFHEHLVGSLEHAQLNNLVTLALDARQNFTGESELYVVRFDEYKCAFRLAHDYLIHQLRWLVRYALPYLIIPKGLLVPNHVPAPKPVVLAHVGASLGRSVGP